MQYFHLTENECNLQTVTTKVREGFNDDALILVQANGYRIEDNEATRGKL